MTHLPTEGKPLPLSTYRLQLRPPAENHPGFTFDDATAALPYLASLGVTQLYCSPYLQAAPGSAHGYDVVDHTRLNEELGGAVAFQRMVDACRSAGVGLVLDVVPNHMAVSEPQTQNAPWWSVLRDGPASPYAEWFDIDWDSPGNAGRVLVPVLGAPLEDVLEEIAMEGDPPSRIRYYDHVLPIAAGTAVPGDVQATLARQHYRLCHWALAGSDLNYRRFFDVTTLAGVRVEVPEVFAQTHRLVLDQVREGILDGLRIDHPDGLADPDGYLRRLDGATGGAWVVVEKILEPGERLPGTWKCCGTTGYDVLNNVMGLFVDPSAEQPLTDHWNAVTGDSRSYREVVTDSKRQILRDVLGAEVNRLVALAIVAGADQARQPGYTAQDLREALVEVLVAFEVYRAYVTPGTAADQAARGYVQEAVSAAKRARPDRAAAIDLIGQLALGTAGQGREAVEFVTRFQQTCGPVMAKGVEDTTFYRYLRLSGLNEVGGSPAVFGMSVADFHQACLTMSEEWPASMTTLSTHDTKRSEDVRARLVLLSQDPGSWIQAVNSWSAAADRYRSREYPDAAIEQLVWQTVFGAWPLHEERLVGYLEKAVREAKVHTSWLAPQQDYESAAADFARAVLADASISAEVAAFVRQLAPAWRATSLAQKLVQLTMPGVADTYQGTELFDLSLVDPDNRRPVDFGRRAALLAGLDAGGPPSLDDTGTAKLHVVARALRLRRDNRDVFLAPGSYTPLESAPRALAFARADRAVTIAPVRASAITPAGWADDVVVLPPGRWRNVLTGTASPGGEVRLADVLWEFPVALLARD